MMRMLYKAFVYFTNCIEEQGNTWLSYLEALVKLQKGAIKKIARARIYKHILPLFQIWNWYT